MSVDGGCPNDLFQDECQLEVCNTDWGNVNDFSEFRTNSTFFLLCDSGFGVGYTGCGLCDNIYDYSSCCKANPTGGDSAYSCMNSYIQTAAECTSGTAASEFSVFTSLLTEQLNISKTSAPGMITTSTTALDLSTGSSGASGVTTAASVATNPAHISVIPPSVATQSNSGSSITSGPALSPTASPAAASTTASSAGSQLQASPLLLTISVGASSKFWGVVFLAVVLALGGV